MEFHSEPRLSIFSCRTFCGLWTNLSGISSLRLRRITYCFNDSRRVEALSFLGDADDGTSRRCRVAARPSNAESARNRRLFTPGFAAAVSKSKTHIGAKCPHPNVYQYPRNACRISKSICQDAFNAFRRYIPMAQQQDASYLSSLLHDSPDHSWADRCDIGRTLPSHLQYPTIWDGQRHDFNRQSRVK